MGDLKTQLSDDIKTAMKAGDKFRTGVLRMLISEIKYDEVAGKNQKELSDAEQVAVVARYHKRLKKSLSDFAGSDKLPDIEKEIAIAEEYLPKQASREVIEDVVKQLISEESSPQFSGVMKQAMAKLKGAADGKLVSEVVKELLG